MPDFSALVQVATELGPLAGLALLFGWQQSRTAQRLLDSVLIEIRELRASSTAAAAGWAEVVGELRGIRADLGRAETTVQSVSERSTEHGLTLREHARRLDALEQSRTVTRK